MKKGKLIVIEGSDGAGKTTQLGLLKAYLDSAELPVESVDFPRYYDSFYGKMIANFLRGEYGPLDTVNPYLISIVYAADRGSAAPEMHKWLKEGKIILSNRYATSNLAHQSGRIAPLKRKAFIQWDLELEYEVNNIPKEDVVIFLHVPVSVSLMLMKNNDRKGRAYMKGKKDMVEKDTTYLKKSEEAYLSLVRKFPHWVKIECVDNDGNLRTREDIHEEVKKVLANKGILDVK
jgi:dTMP kinase